MLILFVSFDTRELKQFFLTVKLALWACHFSSSYIVFLTDPLSVLYLLEIRRGLRRGMCGAEFLYTARQVHLESEGDIHQSQAGSNRKLTLVTTGNLFAIVTTTSSETITKKLQTTKGTLYYCTNVKQLIIYDGCIIEACARHNINVTHFGEIDNCAFVLYYLKMRQMAFIGSKVKEFKIFVPCLVLTKLGMFWQGSFAPFPLLVIRLALYW